MGNVLKNWISASRSFNEEDKDIGLRTLKNIIACYGGEEVGERSSHGKNWESNLGNINFE